MNASVLAFHKKTWSEYKDGFNDGTFENYWLGNDIIHMLSAKDRLVQLRIDLWKSDGEHVFGEFDNFQVMQLSFFTCLRTQVLDLNI